MAQSGPAEHSFFAASMDRRGKALFLGSLMVTMFLAALDQTVVATATPRIVADLEGFSLYSWLFTSCSRPPSSSRSWGSWATSSGASGCCSWAWACSSSRRRCAGPRGAWSR